MMNGFEWAYAGQLMLNGMPSEAAEVARAIRDRYDGKKRNPWNEFECGSNYARSMAAFGLIPAALGFKFDLTRGMLGFEPKMTTLSRCFWSLGTVWGEYRNHNGTTELEIAGGRILLKELQLHVMAKNVFLNGKEISFLNGKECIQFNCSLSAGDILRIDQN